MLRRAQYTGEVCGRCGRALAPDEPVYIAAAYDSYGAFGRRTWHHAPTCEQCAPQSMVERGQGDHTPACEGCGRIVVLGGSMRAYNRRLVFCSVRCRWAYYK